MTVYAMPEVQIEEDRARLLACATALVVGSALCTIGAFELDPDALGDLGIVTVMMWQSWAGLGLLIAGFTVSLTGTLVRTTLPWLYLLALVAALHLAPAYAYGPLRYSWAWKHIGIIDYIIRHHSLDRNADFLPAYHNWPGFFLACAWVAERFSLGPLDVTRIAAFTPPVLETLYLFVLHALYSKISTDKRLIFLAQFVFLTGNWVGQDYFSPQGTMYLFYLLAMLICLGPLRKPVSVPEGTIGWLSARLALYSSRSLPINPLRTMPSVAFMSSAALLAITVVIVVSHQLTPLVLAFSLTGLALIRRIDFGFAIFAFIFNAIWILYFAAPFVSRIITSELGTFGDAFLNVAGNMSDLSAVSSDQAVVSIVSRVLTGSIVLLALIGCARRMRSGHVDGPVLVMLVAPLPVAATTSYGGEVIFRIFLFMLPSLAFLVAATVFPSETANRSPLLAFGIAFAGSLLIVGFLFSNNGKDLQYRFRQTEVDAAAWLYSRAPEGTLLIEGARNYPAQFMNYENFTYLAITNETPQARRQILDDPAEVFARWLGEPKWHAGFVILTHSQKAYAESEGKVPPGAFDRMISRLSTSPKFKIVYRNADAVIFTLNISEPSNR